MATNIGADAFKAVSLALKLAQHSINMAFWGIDPGMLLVKGAQSNYDPRNTLAEILLAKAAQGVKVKMVIWDHPKSFIGSGSDGGSKIIHQNNSRNLGMFRTATQAVPNIDVKITNAYSGLWAGGSFHQKLIVVDIEEPSRATAFVMGHNMMPNYWEQTSLSPRNSKRDYYLSMTAGGGRNSPFSYQAHSYVLDPMIDVSTQIWGGGITDVYHSFERIWTLNEGATSPTHASLTQSEFVTQGRRGASQVAATFSRYS